MSDPFHPTDSAHVPSNRASRSRSRRVQQRSRRSRGFPFSSGHACGAPLNGDTGISEGRLLSCNLWDELSNSVPASGRLFSQFNDFVGKRQHLLLAGRPVPSIHAKRPSSTATNLNSSAGAVTWSPQNSHHWVSDPHACCCANFEQRCNSVSLSLLQEVDQQPAGVDKQVPSDSAWLPAPWRLSRHQVSWSFPSSSKCALSAISPRNQNCLRTNDV